MYCILCEFEAWMPDVMVRHLIREHQDVFKRVDFNYWLGPKTKCICGESFWIKEFVQHLKDKGGLDKHAFDLLFHVKDEPEP